MNDTAASERRVTLALGILLLLFGTVALIAQVADLHLAEDAWPALIIVPGLALMVVGLVTGREAGTGLTVAGTIVTTVGAVLLYQSATGDWASWAYAWALVGPTAAGTGLLLSGLRNGDAKMTREGTNTALGGLVLFAIGYVFFVGIVGLGGAEPTIGTTWVMPALLVLVGVGVIARAVLFGDRDTARRSDEGAASAAGPGGDGGPGRPADPQA